ncbi:hypothetical protein [Alkaliphilus peptidifermentans]|uniref:Uncharacterized protein n=1 Tax=Alkaliphilus peptidifermentans DSM 18978 TaxID=1120976 RepID=A0A1G5EDE7_9FIRM|nr:hypothetical protein [Alkaliphilus peptidifermentans]SCY24992.1 hypothetical protein SAMN03080606_01125 [Alkaliphilus peptidifermentans DSM 18978]
MISTSENYKEKVSSDYRKWKGKIEIYFEGENNPPTVFDDEEMISLSLLEELSGDALGPVGSVTANELRFTLNDTDKMFLPTNTESPYYQKQVPGIIVKAFLGLEVGGDFEYIPLGKFKTSTWNYDYDGLTVNATCYDILADLMKQPMPIIPIQYSKTLKEAFEVLFYFLGLSTSEYSIDSGLTQMLDIFWYEGDTVGECLEKLATAGFSSVYVDRYGVIKIRRLLNHEAFISHWTGEDQILSMEIESPYDKIYSGMDLTYKKSYVGNVEKPEEILSLTDLQVPSGNITLDRVSLNGPVAFLHSIELKKRSSHQVYLDSAEVGVNLGKFILSSPLGTTVDLNIYGYKVEEASFTIQQKNSTVVGMVGEKTYFYETQYIQNEGYAVAVSANMLKMLSFPSRNVRIEARGNPALEVGDVIKISDERLKVVNKEILVTKLEYAYDGGLSCSVYGMAKEALS